MQGAGCRVQGAGCRVQGAGCRGAPGDEPRDVAGCVSRREDGACRTVRVQASGFRMQCSAFRVEVLGLKV